jgi:hypothetical protein
LSQKNFSEFLKWGRIVHPQIWGRFVTDRPGDGSSRGRIIQGPVRQGDVSSRGRIILGMDHYKILGDGSLRGRIVRGRIVRVPMIRLRGHLLPTVDKI